MAVSLHFVAWLWFLFLFVLQIMGPTFVMVTVFVHYFSVSSFYFLSFTYGKCPKILKISYCFGLNFAFYGVVFLHR